jgi:hypothetical protein
MTITTVRVPYSARFLAKSVIEQRGGKVVNWND